MRFGCRKGAARKSCSNALRSPEHKSEARERVLLWSRDLTPTIRYPTPMVVSISWGSPSLRRSRPMVTATVLVNGSAFSSQTFPVVALRSGSRGKRP